MASRTTQDITPEEQSLFHPFRESSSNQATMVRRKAAQTLAAMLAKELKERYHASKVLLFGSALRDDFNVWSDIDLAVWGISTSDYFKAVAYATGFSRVFKIDLVDAEDCRDSLFQHIKENGVEL